jgi:hypothetical protein
MFILWQQILLTRKKNILVLKPNIIITLYTLKKIHQMYFLIWDIGTMRSNILVYDSIPVLYSIINYVFDIKMKSSVISYHSIEIIATIVNYMTATENSYLIDWRATQMKSVILRLWRVVHMIGN